MANITKKNNTIKLTEKGGCAFSIYGFSFFLAGLVASLFFFSDEHRRYHPGWDEQAFGFTIITMFMAVGLLFIWFKKSIIISKKTHDIRQLVGLLIKKTQRVIPFNEITSLDLSQGELSVEPAINSNKEDSNSYFLLQVKGKNKTNIRLAEGYDQEEITLLALDVAALTGIQLNSRIPIKYTRTPSLDSSKASLEFAHYLFKKSFTLIFSGFVLYLLAFSNNWDLKRLHNFDSNAVYVEFPDVLFSYKTVGEYDYPILFYQYKPTLTGNNEKYYIELDNEQYQLYLDALDDQATNAVQVNKNRLAIQSLGQYLFTISIKSSPNSSFKIMGNESHKSTHPLFVQAQVSLPAWEIINASQVPIRVKQKFNILSKDFIAGRINGSPTI